VFAGGLEVGAEEERRAAKCSAPVMVRIVPDIICRILTIRTSCSAELFVLSRYLDNTNNQAERDIRPVKIQQRTSGGSWRTLEGLTEFALVHSYLNTATKWGKDKYQALLELFTTGPWLPPALAPS
jgi:hypothetical protein